MRTVANSVLMFLPVLYSPSRPFVLQDRTCSQLLAMKLYSTAAERNKAPILKVLQRLLPQSGRLLEVASGSGQHVETFAAAMPQWQFSPTDPDTESIASINERVTEAKLTNVAKAIALDASTWPWPVVQADAIFACNMVHISPWAATVGLLTGAGKVLPVGGILVLYGPYVIDGKTADSNMMFSQSLKVQNAEWGVRELKDVEKVANEADLALTEIVPMPANNYCVVFRKGNS
eukprot:gb/GEZJ01004254.1/.p1 GENE.gb/GEZJ01004254.1/~~gb/GEZJ01004254.1/.p1  ORF type:complete len:233 (-),score=26.29 gb/GEZJ01004254.1/:380-1078(-)